MNSQTPNPDWAAQVQHIQDLYGQWVKLLPQLQAAQQEWRHAQHIIRTLSQYYDGGTYLQHMQAWEDSEGVTFDTDGNYSVLSEDALWDAFDENRALAWQWLRMAIQVLDTQTEADNAEQQTAAK